MSLLSSRNRFLRSRKRVALVSAVSMSVAAVALAGCGSSGGGGSDTLAKIKKSKTISVADCLNFKPFGYYASSGQPQGYDVDLANLLAKKLGAKLKLVNVTSDNRIPYLQTGKVDVVFCNFTITQQRAKAIDFTIPYVVSGEGVLVNTKSGITSVNDLSGKKIAVTKGSTNATLLKKYAPHAKTLAFNDDNAAIQAVKSHQADAFIEDLNYLTYQASTSSNLKLLKGTLGDKEYNGWGVKKGDKALLNYLNSFIRSTTVDGQSTKLFKKWFHDAPLYPLNYTTKSSSGLDLVKSAEAKS